MGVCVGLFGTCGGSTWRNEFIQTYKSLGMEDGVDYYNPQVEDWKPECADIEAEHLVNDSVLCWPVTGETYGLGSLGEVGFSILNSIRMDDRRDFIVMIEQELDPQIMIVDENGKPKGEAKESLRMRALVKAHLKKLRLSNVFLVDNLDQMQEVSLRAYQTQKHMEEFRLKFNPHRKG